MSITRIQSTQTLEVALNNLVYQAPGCYCGHYIFYSAACRHRHTSHPLKCRHKKSRLGNIIFCTKPAANYIMSNYEVVDLCPLCRGTARPPTRPMEQAADPSPNCPLSMTMTPAGAVNDHPALLTANVPPRPAIGTQNVGSNTISNSVIVMSNTQNGGVLGFSGPPRD